MMQLMRREEVSDWMGVSRSYISKLMTEGLPYFKIGAAARYDPEEILAWLKAKRKRKTKRKVIRKKK